MTEEDKTEQQDLIGNLRNDIVEAFQKRKPPPYIATYVLETIKQEILNEVFKREFTKIPTSIGANK